MVERGCLLFSIVPNLSTAVRKRCRPGSQSLSNAAPPLYPFKGAKSPRIITLATEKPTHLFLPQLSAETHSRFLIQLPTKSLEEQRPVFWSSALIELLAGIISVGLCKLCSLPVLGPKFSLTLSALVQACQMVIPFSLIFWLTELVPTGLTKSTDARFRIVFGSRSLLHVALFCACVSMGEELLFRSWVLAGLCAVGVPPPFALALSALIFGLLHAYTRVYMVLATVAGLLFGTMFLSTGSLLQPLVVHFFYDFLTVMIMKFRWKSHSPIIR